MLCQPRSAPGDAGPSMPGRAANRTDARRRLSARELLRKMDVCAGRERGPARPDHARGSRNRPGRSVRAQGRAALTAEQVPEVMARGRLPRPATVERQPIFRVGDAIRTRNIHPAHTHPPATLRPRQARRHHRLARGACFPGYECAVPGGECPTALHREIPGARFVGRGRQSARYGLYRSVGGLSCASLIASPASPRTPACRVMRKGRCSPNPGRPRRSR